MKKLILILSTLFLFQCEKDNLNSYTLVNHNGQSSDKSLRISGDKDSDDFLELGEKIINPYTISNMERALEILKIKKIDTKNIHIKANYLYVRILPKNEEEFNIVNSDSEIDLFEYPLDYKIKKQGNKYKDPSSKDSNYTWLYCAIPITKEFDKKIKVEILEKLYLPFGNGKEDNYGLALKAQNKENEGLLMALDEEALILTGNKEPVSQKKSKIAYWQPSGRIRVWDERLWHNDFNNTYGPSSGSFIPVPQCLVRANRLFSTYTVLTDEQGFYSFTHSFSNGNLNFSIKWDRSDFDIRTGSYGQAYYNGPSQSYGWNLGITETSTPDNYIYAHVHRAAWYYYYKNTFGVISPPNATFAGLGGKIHLGAKQGGGRSHYFAFNGAWLASDVKVTFDLNDQDSRAIFGTTIHELTHAAHWTIGMTYTAYCTNAGQAARLAESWAQAVGWHVTRQVYGVSVDPLGDFDHTQLTSLGKMHETANCIDYNYPWYTPLFIDLMDNYNQVVQLADRPNDVVSGFGITELQNFLIARPTNWYTYRDFLVANSTNTTTQKTNASQLFSDYD